MALGPRASPMLKWLRKYNTWILVIGGVLLMIAFLMPTAITELGQRSASGPVFKFNGRRVNGVDMNLAAREMFVLQNVAASANPMQPLLIAEGPEHWIMLTDEAKRAGLMGGPQDGAELISQLVDARAELEARFVQGGNPADIKDRARKSIESIMTRLAAERSLTDQQLMQAWAKLKGVLRLKILYGRAPRYSDRRLAMGAQRLDTSATIEYVLIPPEREMAQIAAPTDEDIVAHFEKYKNVALGEGEFGFGYQLPDRVQVEWLTISRDAIRQTLPVDTIEVEKRFLKQYPSGAVPAGIDEAAERARIETAVVNEQLEKVMKSADQAVRAELDRAKSKLASQGDYKVLSDNWSSVRPEFGVLAQVVVDRVKERHDVVIPKPGVNVSDRWMTANDIGSLPGIGGAFMTMGSRTEAFTAIALSVRELSPEKPAYVVQAGLASSDSVQDNAGNRYFFRINEARKTSPPEALADVRERVVSDIKRLRAYEALLAKLDSIRATTGTADGLETLAQADPNADGEASKALIVNKGTVTSRGINPPVPAVDTEKDRMAILEVARGVDLTKDVSETPIASRVYVSPAPKALSVFASRVVGVAPVTMEKLRTMSVGIARALQSEEIVRTPESDPFSFAAFKARTNFEYLDEDLIKAEQKRKEGKSEDDGDAARL